MDQTTLGQIIGLLTSIVVYLQLKKRNDGLLIEKKNDLATKAEKLQQDNFKLKVDLLDEQMKTFKNQVETVVASIETARAEIKQTNDRWAQVQKGISEFTTKLKVEADFTDQKIRKVEDMAMATDKKVEDYRSEIIELGKDVFMIKGKKPNGS